MRSALPSALRSYDASLGRSMLARSARCHHPRRVRGITLWLLGVVRSLGRRRASPATPTTPPDGWPSLRDFGRAIAAKSAATDAPPPALRGASPEVAYPRDADVLLRSFLRSPWLARAGSWLLLVLSPRLAAAKALADDWNDYCREYGVLTGVVVGVLLLWALGWVIVTTLGLWRADDRASRHVVTVRAEWLQHVAVHGDPFAASNARDREGARLQRKRRLLAALDRGLRARLHPLGLSPKSLLDATWGQPFHPDGTTRELSAEELHDWILLHDWKHRPEARDGE